MFVSNIPIMVPGGMPPLPSKNPRELSSSSLDWSKLVALVMASTLILSVPAKVHSLGQTELGQHAVGTPIFHLKIGRISRRLEFNPKPFTRFDAFGQFLVPFSR